MRILSEILIIISLVFMLIGVIGMFKFPNFYKRVLIASKIETAGTLTMLLGVAVRHGISFFTLRVLLLFCLLLIISPMVTYILVRYVRLSGFELLPPDERK